jgi:hypothetical protein
MSALYFRTTGTNFFVLAFERQRSFTRSRTKVFYWLQAHLGTHISFACLPARVIGEPNLMSQDDDIWN